MRSFFLWICVASLLLSCQSTPEPPNIEKKIEATTPIEAPPVPVTIKKTKESRKKMSLAARTSKPPMPKLESLPPNTISNCPAGINGALVGPIENGRYCFTNHPEASKKCLSDQDELVRQRAELYCGKLKGHWQRKGLWKFGPGSDLRVEKTKRYSCQCGTWRGKPLCKSFFEFDCETIETR